MAPEKKSICIRKSLALLLRRWTERQVAAAFEHGDVAAIRRDKRKSI
jgi:hypothetical protein